MPGITRKVVLEICEANAVPFRESLFSKEAFLEMDEAFIAGTGSEITPIVQVDDTMLGNGKPGPVTRLIQDKFFELT